MRTAYTLAFAAFTMAAAAPTLASGGRGPKDRPGRDRVEVVQNFEIEKYLGDWYEIGSIPRDFEEGCACSRATYTMRDGERIAVRNECRVGDANGRFKVADGTARFKGDKREGKLEVSFFGSAFADYYVVDVGPEYEYAVVSNGEGSSLWLLSREPKMARATSKALLAKASGLGIRTSDFKYQNHEGCWFNVERPEPPAGDTPPNP